MPVRVVGLTWITGMLVARRKFYDGRAPGVQPQPKRAAPGRVAEVSGDGPRIGEAQRVSRPIGRDVAVGHVDLGGDAREQRPGHWALLKSAIESTAKLSSFAGTGTGQRRRESRSPQPRLARVDLVDRNRYAVDHRRDTHRTVTFTAGE